VLIRLILEIEGEWGYPVKMVSTRCPIPFPTASLRIYFDATASPNWKPKNIRDLGAWYPGGNSLRSRGSAEILGVPFGFAQGRLSTAVVLRVREALPPLRMTGYRSRNQRWSRRRSFSMNSCCSTGLSYAIRTWRTVCPLTKWQTSSAKFFA
jgi:hypothetical protein